MIFKQASGIIQQAWESPHHPINMNSDTWSTEMGSLTFLDLQQRQ